MTFMSKSLRYDFLRKHYWKSDKSNRTSCFSSYMQIKCRAIKPHLRTATTKCEHTGTSELKGYVTLSHGLTELDQLFMFLHSSLHDERLYRFLGTLVLTTRLCLYLTTICLMISTVCSVENKNLFDAVVFCFFFHFLLLWLFILFCFVLCCLLRFGKVNESCRDGVYYNNRGCGIYKL